MNIRVMVVEDEPPIMRTIVNLIQQCGKDFSVCCTAKNGVEAELYLRKAPVDVIFTDIRMPLMDGLALMEVVHNDFPDIFIVVLSGYQDFEYAKHAVRYSAFEYLLKPISKDAMSEMLESLKTAYLRRDRQVKTAKLLASLHKTDIHERSQLLDTYLVMLICAGPAPLFDDEDLLLPGFAFWDEAAGPFLNENKGWLFLGRTSAERIMIRELTDPGQIPESASEIFAALSPASPAGAGPIALTALYCSHPIPFSSVGGAVRALQRSLPAVQRVGESQLLPLSSIANPPRTVFFPAAEADGELRELARSLADALAAEPLDKIADRLAACLDSLNAKFSSYIAINDFFNYVLSLYGDSKTMPADIRIVVYEAVYQSLSHDELRQNLLNVFESLRAKEDAPKEPELAANVKKYLDEFYRGNITSEDLAGQFGYVPSYICRVFRRTYGVSPAGYVTKLRIGGAKALLRNRPELLVKEIAFLVGYKDQYHFSKTFKKEEGVWPTDYRG